VVIYYNA